MTAKPATDEMVALKPCPFCGMRLEKSEAFSTRRQTFFVHPADYESEGCIMASTVVCIDDPQRVAAWNTRIATLDAAEQRASSKGGEQ